MIMRSVFLIVVFGLISGCSKPDIPLPEAKKLVLVKKLDSLKTPDNKLILFKELTEILPYQTDKLILVFGKDYQISIADSGLNIKEYISLKEKEFYFNNLNIISAALNGDSLCLISNFYNYNIYSLLDKSLNKRKFNFSQVPVFINNVAFIKENVFASSVNRIPKWSYSDLVNKNPDNSKLTFGLKHLPNGEAVSIYSASKELFDYEEFETDKSYVSRSDNYIIYGFEISKKVFVFDLKDSLFSSFSLAVDNKYWQKPRWEYRSGRKSYCFTSLMYKPLQTKKDYIYQLIVHVKDGECPDILKYDIYGKIVGRYSLPGLQARYGYNFTILNDKVYIYSMFNNEIFIYEGIE